MSRLILPKRITECGRKSLICWVNKQLSLTLSDLTCLSDGSIYCFLVNELRTHIIPRKKIRDRTSTLGYLHNYKLLQDAFFNLGVNKVIPVEQLMANDSRALQTFTSWFKCFFELNYSPENRTLTPPDPDKPKSQSDLCDEQKLVNPTKTKDKSRRKESTVNRCRKMSTLPTEKNRLRGSGDVVCKDQPRKIRTYKRSKSAQKEIGDQKSDATFTVDSQDDLKRLSRLSLTPTEKDSQTKTCLNSNNDDVQTDRIIGESKVSTKITKEKLPPENVSKILEKTTKLSCEAEIQPTCEHSCNFGKSASVEPLGFTNPEQGFMTPSTWAAGRLNEDQLSNKMLTEKPINENKESVSKCVTDLESKTSGCSLKDDPVTQSLVANSESESLNKGQLHKEHLAEQPITENQECISESHTEMEFNTSTSSLEVPTEGEDVSKQLFGELATPAKSTLESANEDQLYKDILVKQQRDENQKIITECSTEVGCKTTECSLRKHPDDDHPITKSLDSSISQPKCTSRPPNENLLKEKSIDENQKFIPEFHTQPMSKTLKSSSGEQSDDESQIKQQLSKSTSRSLNEDQWIKNPLVFEQTINEHDKITQSFSESVSQSKSLSEPLNEDQLPQDILSNQPIDENQECISECFTDPMSKISESPKKEHANNNDLIIQPLCEPVSLLKSTLEPLNKSQWLQNLLPELPIDKNKKSVPEASIKLVSKVAECSLEEHTGNDVPFRRSLSQTDSLSKSTAGPLNEDQLLKEILAEQPVGENQEVISECFTELMFKTAECSWDENTDDKDPITQSLCDSSSLSEKASGSLSGRQFRTQALSEEVIDGNQEGISECFTKPMFKISESSFEEHAEGGHTVTQVLSGPISLPNYKLEPINERQVCEDVSSDNLIDESQECISECLTDVMPEIPECSSENQNTLDSHLISQPFSGSISQTNHAADSMNERQFFEELSSEKLIDESKECNSECLTEPSPKVTLEKNDLDDSDDRVSQSLAFF